MAVLRERGVIRHRVLKTQPTESAIRQIEVYLFTQPSLGTNAEAVTKISIRTIRSGSTDGRPVWL
jgi:hypothetical protein